ncbi:MAG: putative sulfate exporter family transporter, partial [Acidobacteriaceae bacterium]
VAKTYLPVGARLYPVLSHLGQLGLTVVLFLIGTGLSKNTLHRVGIRPFLQGVCLWAIIAVSSLLAIRAGWITL